MIADRFPPFLNLFNVFMIFLNYGFYIPCKYCITTPYNYCKKTNKHREHNIIQEKYSDLNEKHKQLEIALNSLIEMIHENNDNINDRISELLRSVNAIIENKLSDIDCKLSILEKKEINKIKKNSSNTCYRGRNIS